MSIRKDDSGLESLPLKLMVIAVVASLSIVPASQALDGLRTREFARKAELQLAVIASCAEVLALHGPGNIRTISADFGDQGADESFHLTIGDARNGTNASCIILETRNGRLIVKTLERPPVWLCSPEGTSLEIDSPVFNLRMSAQLADRCSYVLVEVC